MDRIQEDSSIMYANLEEWCLFPNIDNKRKEISSFSFCISKQNKQTVSISQATY